jgi:uncharacterized protein YjbI with pentapeptide repeats
MLRANLWNALIEEANFLYANLEGVKGLPADIDRWAESPR